MILQFLKEDALAALKINLDANLEYYCRPKNGWIREYFGDEDPFSEFKVEVREFTLNCSTEREQGKTDVENVITLYSAMRGISDTQATDERLWAGMCHSNFWEYVGRRWNMEHAAPKREDIMAHYFFGYNKKRSLIANTLSKLWWIGRLTYDHRRSDPFELTRYFENDFSTKTLMIFSNNFMGSPGIARGLLSALCELEKEGFSLPGQKKRAVYYEATKYLNIWGGTVILDYFSQEEIKDRVIRHLKEI